MLISVIFSVAVEYGSLVLNPLNPELNLIFHLLALLGSHHILHVSRVRINVHFNPLNAKLNPICHLLALLGAHHILHVSGLSVKTQSNKYLTAKIHVRT